MDLIIGLCGSGLYMPKLAYNNIKKSDQKADDEQYHKDLARDLTYDY